MTLIRFTSFADILSTKIDEVQPPPTLPTGSYNGVVKQWKESKTRKTDKSPEEFPVAQFVIVPTAPGKDVSPEEFAHYQELGGQLSEENLVYEKVVAPRSFHATIKFMRECMGANAETFEELLGATTGSDVAFVVKHYTGKSGNVSPQIDSFFAYGTNVTE